MNCKFYMLGAGGTSKILTHSEPLHACDIFLDRVCIRKHGHW